VHGLFLAQVEFHALSCPRVVDLPDPSSVPPSKLSGLKTSNLTIKSALTGHGGDGQVTHSMAGPQVADEVNSG